MIKKISDLTGKIACPACMSFLEWDSPEDIKTSAGNKYIKCPNCGYEIVLHRGVKHWKNDDLNNGVPIYVGSSQDEKPENVEENSVYLQLDTGKFYCFEEEQWVEVSQGGGSGGTSNHTLLTNRDIADQHPMSAITGLTNELNTKTNVIETVKVNGTALTPDANKAVDIEIDENIFVAKAFSTPVADIADAIEAGQTILVRYGNQTNLYQAVIAASSAQDKSSAFLVVATISTEQGVKMADIIEYTITAAGWTQSAIITVDEAVFMATYGTTPAADIIAAIEADKVICVTYGAGMPTEVVTFAHHNNGTAYLTTAGIGLESGVAFLTESTYTVSGTSWSVAVVQGANRADIQAIQAVIPVDATSSNQLATKSYTIEVFSDRLDGIDTELNDHEERILELENSGGGDGGEDNIIESISVFEVPMEVDQNKNVNLRVPTFGVTRIGNNLDADWQTISDALYNGQPVYLFQQIGDVWKYTMFTKWEHNGQNDYNVWFGTEKYHAEAGDFTLTYVEG